MAEDKKKETEQKGDAKQRKKALSPLVLIAVGAVAGGAGVVFAVPPKVVEVKVPPKPPAIVDVTHPDEIKKQFNPKAPAGKPVARVSLKFVYSAREDRLDEAFTKIKENWEQANSNVLLILKARTTEELGSEAGVRMLEHDLIEDLDRTLFPGEEHDKAASVTRVLWTELVTQ